MKAGVLKHALTAKPTAADIAIVDLPSPACPPGGVRARVAYLSLDPYVGSRVRGRHMGEPPPAPRTEPLPGAVVAQVVESQAPNLKPGDWIHTMAGGWAEDIAAPAAAVRKIDPQDAPLEAHIGVLGMPGLTAWAGVTQLARVGPGDVFLVDAAAGAVGGTAGQIARIKGAKRVVGVAGGAEKCRLVTEVYGFDACADYKSPDFPASLDKALDGQAPTVHFENVGVGLLTLALSKLGLYGRAVVCGLVDQYHADAPPPQIPAGLVVGKRAQVLGLVVYDFYPRWNEYVREAAAWIREGRLAGLTDRVAGLEAAPALFERLMDGANVGKCVVEVSAPG